MCYNITPEGGLFMKQKDIREFELETVLSIACNAILTQNLYSVFDCVNYITNNNIIPPTPELQLYAQMHILNTHPELIGVVPEEPICSPEEAHKFIQTQQVKFGNMLSLSPLHNGLIEQVDPIKKMGSYREY